MGILKNLLLLTLIVSCGKRGHITQLGQMAEFTVRETGKVVEKVGRVPRIIGRKLLGIEDDVSNSENRDSILQERIDNLETQINELYDLIGDSNTDQDLLEQEIALFNQRITELETNDSIVEFIDPCGDDVGEFDEVLMVTSNGNYVAYFQQGSRRFLTVLPDGNFETTDKQKCRFNISGGVYSE